MTTHDTIHSNRRIAEEFRFRDIDDEFTIDEPEDFDALDDVDDDDELDGFDEVDEVEVELVVLALAGTTVADDGLIERAFERALDRAGIAIAAQDRVSALGYIRHNIGRDKREVFHRLLAGQREGSGAAGSSASHNDAEEASHAAAEFEAAFAELIEREGIDPVPGAVATIGALRASGVNVVVISGLGRRTTDTILDALGGHEVVDIVLCSDDVRRGRPHPDLALTALLRCGASSVENMIVVGDTVSDIEGGIAAGAGMTIGVLTGAHNERALRAAGADAVVESVADLPALLGFPATTGR